MTNNSNIISLLREAGECCEALGLGKDLISKIYRSDSDWAFILKIDSLLETSVREVVKSSLKLEVNGTFIGHADLEKFVSGLPMNGRTSLTKLLRATNCDRDFCDFIEATRNVRNAFAHNIKQVDSDLLTVIKTREDWASLVKRLTPIERYNESQWIGMIEAKSGLLRFSILHYTLMFLTLAYHVVLRNPPARLNLKDIG